MSESLTAFVFVQTQFRARNVPELLTRIPEIEEVHRVAGEDSYLLRVRVATAEQLGRLVSDKIERIGSVSSTRTTLVLKTLKQMEHSTLKRRALNATNSPK